MGFRLGDIADHTDNGTLRGIQREIACECSDLHNSGLTKNTDSRTWSVW